MSLIARLAPRIIWLHCRIWSYRCTAVRPADSRFHGLVFRGRYRAAAATDQAVMRDAAVKGEVENRALAEAVMSRSQA